jgi:ribonucleoside-diphosphate reductase alpha chain
VLPVIAERREVSGVENDENFVEDIFRFLDNVLEDFIERAPTEMARAVYSAKRERSVGLGLMGFHSFLQSMGRP